MAGAAFSPERTWPILTLRLAAVGTALGTLAFLIIGDDWRLSNIFLVPDLLVCAVLVAGATMPRSRALPILLLGFGIGVGVFTTANADYLVQNRFGIGAAVGLLTSALAGLFIACLLTKGER